MTTPVSQRTITITITPIAAAFDDKKQPKFDVTYSYWSPVTGLHYTNAQLCDLKIDRPTRCLYVIDFQSSQAGWTVVDTTPNGDSRPLAFLNGPHNQSLQNVDPYLSPRDVYNYFLNYENTVTGDTFSEDPQEGNIPR